MTLVDQITLNKVQEVFAEKKYAEIPRTEVTISEIV